MAQLCHQRQWAVLLMQIAQEKILKIKQLMGTIADYADRVKSVVERRMSQSASESMRASHSQDGAASSRTAASARSSIDVTSAYDPDSAAAAAHPSYPAASQQLSDNKAPRAAEEAQQKRGLHAGALTPIPESPLKLQQRQEPESSAKRARTTSSAQMQPDDTVMSHEPNGLAQQLQGAMPPMVARRNASAAATPAAVSPRESAAGAAPASQPLSSQEWVLEEVLRRQQSLLTATQAQEAGLAASTSTGFSAHGSVGAQQTALQSLHTTRSSADFLLVKDPSAASPSSEQRPQASSSAAAPAAPSARSEHQQSAPEAIPITFAYNLDYQGLAANADLMHAFLVSAQQTLAAHIHHSAGIPLVTPHGALDIDAVQVVINFKLVHVCRTPTALSCLTALTLSQVRSPYFKGSLVKKKGPTLSQMQSTYVKGSRLK